MSAPTETRSREHWRKARAQGMRRFIVVGALRRAVPMSLLVLVALELFEGGAFTRERVLSADFLQRVGFVFAVFLAGGVISSWARWKTYQSLYGDGSST